MLMDASDGEDGADRREHQAIEENIRRARMAWFLYRRHLGC